MPAVSPVLFIVFDRIDIGTLTQFADKIPDGLDQDLRGFGWVMWI